MSQLGLIHLSENLVPNPALKFTNSTSSKLLWHLIPTQTFCKALTILLISTIHHCGTSKLSSSSDEISLSLDDEGTYNFPMVCGNSICWLYKIFFFRKQAFDFSFSSRV